MAGVRGLERLAILAAAVLVAACGSSGTASHTPPPVLATAQATSTALPTAPATQAQAWPGGSLPPGVTVVDEANVIQRLDWSPDGKLLAVMTSGGTTGTGFRVDVLDLAGQKVASFDAFDMAWVDDTHIMTLAASADDPDQETATVYSIDGTESSVVPGAFDGILGNGHGSVALMAPVAASEATAKESFQVWSNGQLGPRIAGYGYPWVWSPDGRLLALSRVTSNGGAATGVGGPIPGILSVLELPEKTVVLSRRYGDIRGLDVYFSPDGTRLATSDGVVLDLADARSMQLTGQPEGWTASGSLVVVGQDRRVSLWTPAGTAVIPKAFEWAVFGPNAGDVATLPAANQNPDNPSLPITAVVRRAGSSASIPLNSSVQVTTWSSTGICFISLGTANAQAGDDRLLRIELPAS
jgi:WD40 repeat protein